MFVRDGAVTPGPSCECDITFCVKGRPKSPRQSRDSTVAARRVQRSRVSRECRSAWLRSPPFKNALKDGPLRGGQTEPKHSFSQNLAESGRFSALLENKAFLKRRFSQRIAANR